MLLIHFEIRVPSFLHIRVHSITTQRWVLLRIESQGTIAENELTILEGNHQTILQEIQG